jgi:aminopeptidase N
MRLILLFAFVMLSAKYSSAQLTEKNKAFTRADTLRGSNGIYRQRWDVTRYDITIEPNYSNKTLQGNNIISFNHTGVDTMQIDLQQPMQIDSIVNLFNQKQCFFRRENNVAWVAFGETNNKNSNTGNIKIYFSGKPREAKRAPWDGGWIWKKDNNGNPWMSVACQGLGASVWYPCKDIQSDKPNNGASLSVIVPDSLTAIANGNLIETKALEGNKKQFTWQVKNSINNYNIVPYIGKYSNFNENYKGKKGNLACSYWALQYNVEKAKKQFTDVPRMLEAFEYWFGAFPFYEDGYKIVESPHLGMEHQSAIAYGNQFKMGYNGMDLSGTGLGLKWDFIIIHESGHEWFANNICTKDIADMWVHEGFTSYSEVLFTDYHYGKENGNKYCIGLRKNIQNDIPIIGPYGVNEEGSGDMYYKANNMLHCIRQIIDNDKKIRKILIGLNKTFGQIPTSSAEVEQYISAEAKKDFTKIFDQYLRTIKIPELTYSISNNMLQYKWVNCVDGFNMPVKVTLDNGKTVWLHATDKLQTQKIKGKPATMLNVDPNFYVKSSVIK